MKLMGNMIIITLIIFVFCIGDGCKKDDPVAPTDTTHLKDTTSHEFRWKIDTIGTSQTDIEDVWGSSDSDVYAVGTIYWPGRQTLVNIIHWDGDKWSLVDYSMGDLSSIFGLSNNDIWSVGYWVVYPDFYALISHWDGAVWNTWKFQQYPDLYSVWGTSSANLYAVGSKGAILKFDGVQWQSLPSGVGENIKGIWGVSGNEIYAVGNYPLNDTGVVLKYDGNRWNKIIENTFKTDIPSGEMAAVWGANHNGFLIGTHVGHDSSWGSFGWPNDDTYIDKIRGTGSNNIFACGSFDLIMHYNGKTFKRYDFYKKPNGGRLTGIFVTEKSVFIVGQSENSRGIVYRGYQ